MDSKTAKNLFEKSQIMPKKRLGQNFLVYKTAVGKFLAAADIRPGDTVLEIGPGTGILTLELAKRAKFVVAIEKDPKMCEILDKLIKCSNVENVKIVQGDIREIKNLKFKIKNYR